MFNVAGWNKGEGITLEHMQFLKSIWIFLFNWSGKSVFIFSRGINMNKQHIVQPNCPYLRKKTTNIITRQCNHVYRIRMVSAYHNHQYPNCSSDPTMHERNIKMILTLYQTDFSISIIYQTHWSYTAWKICDIKRSLFSVFTSNQ